MNARRAEDKTTRTEPMLWTIAPMIGERIPHPPARTATALKSNPNARFHLIVRRVLLPKSIRNGILEISSFIRATSAVSNATSVPAAPIATPTLAEARAGASLMPSPTKITVLPAS